MISPDIRPVPEDFTEKNIPLAMIVQGSFKSYLGDRPPPPKNAPDSGADGDEEAVIGQPYTGPVLREVADNRILVVGDGNFFQDAYLGLDPTNVVFALNAIDWLAQDEGLISIRSRVVTERPLSEVGNATRKVIKALNLVGPSILVIIIGTLVWQYKRMRKRAMEIAK